MSRTPAFSPPVPIQEEQSSKQRRQHRLVAGLHTRNKVALGGLWVVAGVITLAFIGVLIFLLVQGIGYLLQPSFYAATELGVGKQIFNTFYVLILAEGILVPVALSAAIYTVEYAKQGRFVAIIRFAAETLSGVPSIVLGLFGFLFFSIFLGLGYSRLAGALTLLCLNLPVGLRLFEDALMSVGREQREAGLALGATRWHVIRTVVLPSALPGIITGIILTAGKVIAETAALVFTMGTTSPNNVFTLDPLVSSDTLTIHLWYVKTQGAGSIPGLTAEMASQISAGSAALLILLLLVINLGARGVGALLQRRFAGKKATA